MKQSLPYLIAVSILSLSLGSCGSKKEDAATSNKVAPIVPIEAKEVLALGRVEPEAKIVSLASDVSGIVAEVFVKEGQTLEAGQPILSFSHEVKDAEIALAQSSVATKRSQIQADKAFIEQAEVDLQNRKTTYERLRRLALQGAETQQSVDDAKNLVDKQELEIRRLTETMHVSQNLLNEQTKQVALRQAERNRLTVKAPSKGVLLSLDAKVGAGLSANSTLGDFAPDGRTTFLSEVDELFADQIVVGAKAILRNQGSTEELATGKVIYASPYLKKKSLFSDAAGDAEDRRVREVRILIESGKPLLINSRLEAVIQLSKPSSK